MAQYKVPQDVEADDKLLGPFSFRQFVYLLIAGGLVALAVGLFQLFPLLGIVPILPAILFAVLALPLKKDQPMETYLAAVVSYYIKPHVRLWTSGQRESTIKITVPKIVEDSRIRDISGEEANHRLSFLADIVDTGGMAIKNGDGGLMREDLVAEASTAVDMFEGNKFDELNNKIQEDEVERHDKIKRDMREAIEAESNVTGQKRFVAQDVNYLDVNDLSGVDKDRYESSVVVKPNMNSIEANDTDSKKQEAKANIIELANNSDYSVETIAKQAKKVNGKESEVFISLH